MEKYTLSDIKKKYNDYRHSMIWEGAIHKEPQLSTKDAKAIIRDSASWMLRNLYDFDCKEQTNFWYIIKDSYSDSEYSKKVRKYIEKANKKFEIRLISRKRMIEQGFNVYEKAHRHYRVNDGFQMNKNEFVAELNKMVDNEYDFWGCIDRDTNIIQAYSICHVHDEMCWFKYSRANPDFLPKYYPMYGLYDARNRFYLGEQKMKYVLTSARSITQHSEIQSFMIEKFGFRRAYCRLKIYYRPWLQFLINIAFPFRKIIPIRPIKNLLAFEQINRGHN